MSDLTNLFSTNSTDISQIECKVRELKSEMERIENKIKELESVDKGLYVGYLFYVISEPNYFDKEYREYYVFGDMSLSEAQKKLGSIDIGSNAHIYSIDCEKLPEDVFNLFKVWQQLTKFKRKIDCYARLPYIDNKGDCNSKPANNKEAIIAYLEEEIKKVCAELNEKMKAQEMWFDKYAKIY